MTDQEILNKYGFSNIDASKLKPEFKEYTLAEHIRDYHNDIIIIEQKRLFGSGASMTLAEFIYNKHFEDCSRLYSPFMSKEDFLFPKQFYYLKHEELVREFNNEL